MNFIKVTLGNNAQCLLNLEQVTSVEICEENPMYTKLYVGESAYFVKCPFEEMCDTITTIQRRR